MSGVSLKLQPRLFMLAHAGKHLQAQLQGARQLQRSFCEYLAPQPVAWELFKAGPARQAQVLSVAALSLPGQAGIPAWMQAEPLSGILPETEYQLPDLGFELLDPTGQPARSLQISCGRFRTFASGRPDRQLLEYLATLLSYELGAIGFSCLRQDTCLVFAAHPLLAGWNLSLTRLDYPAGAHSRCDGGLRAGLSSAGSGQQSGQLATLHWGPWRINGTSCGVALPFADPDGFAEAFAEALNQQLDPLGLAAVWTPDYELLLCSRQAGQAIEIAALPPEPLSPPDLRLDLPLPEGRYESEAGTGPTGELRLNGQALSFEQPSEPLADWLSQCFNRFSPQTGVHAAVNPEQHLHLQALRPMQPILIEAVSPLLQAALGLQPMRLGELDLAGLDAALERWTLLLNQVLAELPPELPVAQALLARVAEVPVLAGSFSQGLSWAPDALRHSLEQVLAYVEAVMLEVEHCLQSPQTQSTQTLRPLQLELEMVPLPRPAADTLADKRGESEPEPDTQPPPRFDHKI